MQMKQHLDGPILAQTKVPQPELELVVIDRPRMPVGVSIVVYVHG